MKGKFIRKILISLLVVIIILNIGAQEDENTATKQNTEKIESVEDTETEKTDYSEQYACFGLLSPWIIPLLILEFRYFNILPMDIIYLSGGSCLVATLITYITEIIIRKSEGNRSTLEIFTSPKPFITFFAGIASYIVFIILTISLLVFFAMLS